MSFARSRPLTVFTPSGSAGFTGPVMGVTSAPAAPAAAATHALLPEERLAIVAHRIDRLNGRTDVTMMRVRQASVALVLAQKRQRRRSRSPVAPPSARCRLPRLRPSRRRSADHGDAIAASCARLRWVAGFPTSAGSSPAPPVSGGRWRQHSASPDRRHGPPPSWRGGQPVAGATTMRSVSRASLI